MYHLSSPHLKKCQAPKKERFLHSNPSISEFFRCLNLGTFRQKFLGNKILFPHHFFSIQKTRRHKKKRGKRLVILTWPQTLGPVKLRSVSILPTLGCQTLSSPNFRKGVKRKLHHFGEKIKENISVGQYHCIYIDIYIYIRIYKMLQGTL